MIAAKKAFFYRRPVRSQKTATSSDGKEVIWVVGDSFTRSRPSGAYGPTPVAGTVFQYYAGSVQQIGATDIQQDVTNVNWGSIWPKYGINYYNNTGKKPVFALSGVGGTTFSFDAGATDTWSTASSLYANSEAFCDEACAAVGVAYPKYVVMHLGINDAAYSATLANIESDMNSLFTRITTKYPKTQIKIVIIGRLPAGSITSKIASIRKYLVNAANLFPQVSIAGSVSSFPSVAGNPYYLVDGLHLNQTGNNLLADMMGSKWLLNSSYSKWARSIIACHPSDLSTTRKDLVQTFINAVGTNLFDMDVVSKLKAATEEDALFDWAFIYNGSNSGATFVANSHVSTNGTSSTWRISFFPTYNIVSSQQNQFIAVKIKANRTATTCAAIGVGSGTSQLQIGQNGTTAFSRVNDVAVSAFSDAALGNKWYLAERTSSTAKNNYKDAAADGTYSVTQVTNSGTGRLTVGANDVNGVIGSYMDGDFEAVLVGKPSAREIVRAAMENVLTNW